MAQSFYGGAQPQNQSGPQFSTQYPSQGAPQFGTAPQMRLDANQPLLQQNGGGFLPGDRGKSQVLGQTPDISLENLMKMSVVAWVVFSITCLLFGMSYHDSSVEIWTLTLIGAGILCIVIVQSWRQMNESSAARVSIIVAFWLLLAIIVGAWVGLFAYDFGIREYWTAQRLEARGNVLPSEPAGAYGNAGEIVFADEARVDPGKAVGFKDDSVYCVAPVASDAPMDTVQFWAAGVDCCGARGSFICDDAWNPKAHSGVVIRNSTFRFMGADVHAKYMQAVKLAEVTYSIASAEEPIFVRWVANPGQVELNIWRAGMGVLLASIIIASLFCGLQAMAIHLMLRKQ